MRIRNLEDCKLSNRFYGGRAGQKIGIVVDGEPWIAKYPRSGRDLRGKHVPSYTSSPVAEWLGSHIYASAGIPTHETMLGWHGGKVVCACKDFCVGGASLVEFNRLKNTLSDDEEDFVGSPSDSEVVFLQDVLSALSLINPLRHVPGVRERFWDMFVMDAFIKNPDRNNGNWGILMGDDMPPRMAPVYDNGSSLFRKCRRITVYGWRGSRERSRRAEEGGVLGVRRPTTTDGCAAQGRQAYTVILRRFLSKRSASLTASRLGNSREESEDAFGTNVSCYRLPDSSDPRGRAIKPFDYMMTSENPDLARAVLRARDNIDLTRICALVDEVPVEAYGRILMTVEQRESHKRLLRKRYEEGILPAAKRI